MTRRKDPESAEKEARLQQAIAEYIQETTKEIPRGPQSISPTRCQEF